MIHIDFNIYNNRFRKSFTPYEMDVFKYIPNDFIKKTRFQEDDFHLDIIDITYFAARTLCSYHLTEKELYYDIIASLLSHLNFIDATSTSLVLSESRYKRLRDFSKGTRVGEMAQGINSCFVSRRLDFPYIIDFDLAKNKTLASLGIISNGKKPDFVVLNSSLTKIGLLESKGNMDGNVSGDLLKAMTQINDVILPCFDSKLPVSTRFQNNNDFSKKNIRKERKSSINYASIYFKCPSVKDTKILRKLHYASWFYLVGDFERVESILNDGVVPPIQEVNDPTYTLDTDTDKGNPIYWVKDPLNLSLTSDKFEIDVNLFITSRYFHSGELKIGIYKEVIDNLSASEETNTIFQLPDSNLDNLKKYTDGTLLFIRDQQ